MRRLFRTKYRRCRTECGATGTKLKTVRQRRPWWSPFWLTI